ncbi:MAG TPA: hypothetical protein OIM63_02035 [Bacilli bacterium]|nr:hypothetical protein [Bacilli bacterium]
MNFEQKLDIVINEIASVYNLNNEQANLVKQNIIKRVKMYRNMSPNFTNDEVKIVANSSDIGDFFINRLVTNIRNYDFDQTYNRDNTLKGAYTSKNQALYVGNYKFIEDITLDKLKNRIQNVDPEMLRKASLNVFNHELGHALQTSFKGKYGNNDNKYMQLINNLSTKYPNEFKLQATEEVLNTMQKGMIVTRKDDKSKDARNFYSKNAYITHLDEIFNEDEALRITGVNQPQFSYDMGNGFSKNIYNYQSSNYKITSYGKMMKIVMGEKLTFKAMYEDSIVAYEFFDQFKDISDKIYHGKPPMFNILESLNKIKSESSLNESLKLDLFLTICLQRRVAHDLKNPNLTQEDIDKIKNYTSEFNSQMTKNPNLVTQQIQIISSIQNMISKKEKQLGGTVTQNSNPNKNTNQAEVSLYRHPKANELNELERKKQIAKQNNDILLYQQLQNKIENIISANRAKVSPQQWDAMDIDERKSFIQIKMKEAKILKDEDEFSYWNASLNRLNPKHQEITQNKASIQEPIVQTEVNENNSHNLSKDNLDLSGLTGQLRNELTKVQNAYRSMMSDGYIDDEELATLISMNNKIISDGYMLRGLATDSSDLRKINVIISSLEEQKKKMSSMLNGLEENGKIMR